MGAVECKNHCRPETFKEDTEETAGPSAASEAVFQEDGGSETDATEATLPDARRGRRKNTTYDNRGSAFQLQWLNFLVSHTWPQMDQLASHFVEFKIEPLLRQKLPERLKGMTLSKFTIGERPGKIRAIEVYDLPHGTSCVHAMLDLQSEMTVEWQVKGFTFGMKDFSLTGEIVFLVRPFIEEHPGTGGVTMFFINPPEMNFKFTGIARIAEYKGIKGIIRSVLDDALADVLVLPNVVTQLMRYSDFNLYPVVMGDPTPIGMLRIKTLKAKDLPSGDFTFFGLVKGGVDDNYIKISLGNDRWATKVNKASLGASHDFFVYDPEQMLKIDLWDEDQYTEDDHMGHAGPFHLHQAVALSEKDIQFHEPDDKSKPAGVLTLKVDYYHGIPRTLSSDLNAIMLPIREVHMPPSKAHCKVFIDAEMGSVKKRSRVGVVMRNALKERTVDSVMGDMRGRLKQHGLKEADIAKLTATDGLTCTSGQVSMAINECMTFMVPDGAGLDSGEITMTLIEAMEDESNKASKRGKAKKAPVLEVELGRYVIRLEDLRKAPNLTLKGPAVFKHSDGRAFNVEVSAFVCGFKAGKPAKVNSESLPSMRRSRLSIGKAWPA